MKTERPGWLMPRWVALTASTFGTPVYADATSIIAVASSTQNSDRAVVLLGSGTEVTVLETPAEVMNAITRATA